MPPPQELQGWKEIAAYLNIGPRAAQDWEHDFHLPIHRRVGPTKSRVYAISSELDEWLLTHDTVKALPPPPAELAEPTEPDPTPEPEPAFQPAQPKAPKPSRTLLILALLVLCVAALTAYRRILAPPRQPSSFTLRGQTLIVNDQANNPLWEYVLPGVPTMAETHLGNVGLVRFADIDADGLNEVLFAFRDADSTKGPNILLCLNTNGTLRWSHMLGRELRTIRQNRVYANLYDLRWVTTLNRATPSGGIILLGGSRGVTSLFGVQLLDKSGAVVSEYYHPGWLWSAAISDLDNDGWDEVLLGGVNNAYGAIPKSHHQTTLVVLDSREIRGQGPAPPEDERHFHDIESGHEKAVILFPEFGKLPSDNPAFFCLIRGIRVYNGVVEITAVKNDTLHQIHANFQFDTRLGLKQIVPSPELSQLLKPHPGMELDQPAFQKIIDQKLGSLMVLKNRLGARQANQASSDQQ